MGDPLGLVIWTDGRLSRSGHDRQPSSVGTFTGDRICYCSTSLGGNYWSRNKKAHEIVRGGVNGEDYVVGRPSSVRRMLPCIYRLLADRESRCWLRTNHIVEEDGERSFVYQMGSGSIPIMCSNGLTKVCPFRQWPSNNGRGKIIPCDHCGHGHREGSNSQMLCEAWSSTKLVLKQMRNELPKGRRFYPEGTSRMPYDVTTPPLIRRLVWQRVKLAVLRRDRFSCQDCGVVFGAKRRKVHDIELRHGRGGYKWESLEVHHILPRSKGGSDHPGNLKTLCPSCHRKYTNVLIKERAVRLHELRDGSRTMDENEVGTLNYYEDPWD